MNDNTHYPVDTSACMYFLCEMTATRSRWVIDTITSTYKMILLPGPVSDLIKLNDLSAVDKLKWIPVCFLIEPTPVLCSTKFKLNKPFSCITFSYTIAW